MFGFLEYFDKTLEEIVTSNKAGSIKVELNIRRLWAMTFYYVQKVVRLVQPLASQRELIVATLIDSKN